MGIFKKIIKKEEIENDIPYETHFIEAMKKIEELFEEPSTKVISEEESEDNYEFDGYGKIYSEEENEENGGENNGNENDGNF